MSAFCYYLITMGGIFNDNMSYVGNKGGRHSEYIDYQTTSSNVPL